MLMFLAPNINIARGGQMTQSPESSIYSSVIIISYNLIGLPTDQLLVLNQRIIFLNFAKFLITFYSALANVIKMSKGLRVLRHERQPYY